MGTKTSNFGVSKRESHDSSDFYKRFDKVEEFKGAQLQINTLEADKRNKIYPTSSTKTDLPDSCVDLVVGSPPYFVGKEYDEDYSFDEYIDFLHESLTECYRVLKPGGRLAVNIANLGRSPYIELTTYLGCIAHDIGYFPRGQIIWQKADGAGNSCAWGSYMSASNPTIRDLHEYVALYSKGKYGKVDKGKSTLTKEQFLESTVSIWRINPESAKRVGHPAPFPVALPQRLINLFTYENDLVLDPWMGSGTTAIAAIKLGRDWIGYETDLGYIEVAEERIRKERGN